MPENAPSSLPWLSYPNSSCADWPISTDRFSNLGFLECLFDWKSHTIWIISQTGRPDVDFWTLGSDWIPFRFGSMSAAEKWPGLGREKKGAEDFDVWIVCMKGWSMFVVMYVYVMALLPIESVEHPVDQCNTCEQLQLHHSVWRTHCIVAAWSYWWLSNTIKRAHQRAYYQIDWARVGT